MTTNVRRDPFARQDLKRETVNNPTHQSDKCSWCGQSPHRLYRYGTETDGGRFNGYAKGLFCNLQCFDAYHS